jgi:hypothetical protein
MVLVLLFSLFSTVAQAQKATVDVSLSHTGSIKIKTSGVRGFAVEMFGIYRAENVMVGLRNLRTGNEVCDKQTKKILQTWKYPEAVLVSAVGKDGKGSGVLKVRGIAKEITGTYKVVGHSLDATFPIHLSDYKIEPIEHLGVLVEDTAIINITIPIRSMRTPASRVH